MRIEILPLIIGAVVGLLGLAILVDAWTPDDAVSKERRRRPRVARHRGGEALIGLGVLALAVAFAARDSWRFSILVVMIGTGFLLLGAILNGRFLREAFSNRGPLRRRDEATADVAEEYVAPPTQPRVARRPEQDVPRVVEPVSDVAPVDRSPQKRTDSYTGQERRSRPRGKPGR